ncbi:DUF6075 family protein [Natroniella acetigena]|uniref:DUF6075 family protein n=1 Tax=Natroniella acetigena TaxID=52004 RepID=UPI00200B713C|nr:DUF6075 family protein [Natroniella acetigena]MCK8828129.1 DUF6075 family protein [Natroniella acetigena]
MDFYFLDSDHEMYFYKMFERNISSCSQVDLASLLYILSSLDKFRRQVDKFFDPDKQFMADLDKITENPSITLSDSEFALLRLAYHLYTSSDHYNATFINTLSGLSDELTKVVLTALEINIGLNLNFESEGEF